MRTLRFARLDTTSLLVRLSLTIAMILLILAALLYGTGAATPAHADPGTLYVDHATGSGAAPDTGAYIVPEHVAYLPLVLGTYPWHWRDDFNGSTLDAQWVWLNENPARWSLTERPGFLRIKSHEAAPNTENLLSQIAPEGDFDVRTRVLFEPTSNFQMAGIMLQSENGYMMRLIRVFCGLEPPICVGNGIYFDHSGGGGNFAMVTTKKGEAYLRIVRQGNAYTGYYSEDGINWTLVGTHNAIDELPVIGLGTGNDQAGASLNVDFDFFEIRALQ